MLAQRVGEGVAALDVVHHLACDVGEDLVLGLLRQNVERLDQRQAGVDHRRELPREDHDVACLDARLEQIGETTALALGLAHLHDDHAVLAQVGNDVVTRAEVDLILDQLALEVPRCVFEDRHFYLRTATLG
jgi:hypothetical protein